MSGRYIAFEGVEGCGKSTHVKRLAAHLDALVTREPGGTDVGAVLRGLMADPGNTHLDARAEALLMAADRAQHLRELVVPTDRKSTRLNSSHIPLSRMPSSA